MIQLQCAVETGKGRCTAPVTWEHEGKVYCADHKPKEDWIDGWAAQMALSTTFLSEGQDGLIRFCKALRAAIHAKVDQCAKCCERVPHVGRAQYVHSDVFPEEKP